MKDENALFTERPIGSIRRECLDHVIVLRERHLRRRLTVYLTYYHGANTCAERSCVGDARHFK